MNVLNPFQGRSMMGGLITGGVLAKGIHSGYKSGKDADTLDRDVRASMGLKDQTGFQKHKGKILGTLAGISGGMAGHALGRYVTGDKTGYRRIVPLVGAALGSKLAGKATAAAVKEANRSRRDKELSAKKEAETTQQSNFKNSMYQTRQFGKLTDFIKKYPKSVGAVAGGVLGGASGYMIDRKAKLQGNKLKRNAGLVAGLAAGAGLGAVGMHYGAKKFSSVGGFFKNNAGRLISGTLGAAVGATAGIVSQRKKSAKRKAIAGVIGGVAGAGLGLGANKLRTGAWSDYGAPAVAFYADSVPDSNPAMNVKPSALKRAKNIVKKNKIGALAGVAAGAVGGALLGRKSLGRGIGLGAAGAALGAGAGMGIQAGIRKLRKPKTVQQSAAHLAQAGMVLAPAAATGGLNALLANRKAKKLGLSDEDRKALVKRAAVRGAGAGAVMGSLGSATVGAATGSGQLISGIGAAGGLAANIGGKFMAKDARRNQKLAKLGADPYAQENQ